MFARASACTCVCLCHRTRARTLRLMHDRLHTLRREARVPSRGRRGPGRSGGGSDLTTQQPSPHALWDPTSSSPEDARTPRRGRLSLIRYAREPEAGSGAPALSEIQRWGSPTLAQLLNNSIYGHMWIGVRLPWRREL